MDTRALPHNLEAEQSVIAALISDNELILESIDKLKKEDFYNKNNQNLYSYILKMYKEDKFIDLITLLDYIKPNTALVGGISYVSSISSSIATTANFKSYVEIIKSLALERNMILKCRESIEFIYSKSKTIPEIIADFENNFLNNVGSKEEILTDEELMHITLDDIVARTENQGELSGMKTGYKYLDAALNGINKGHLIILGGRPAQGKTFTALNIADGLAENHKVMLFELEMTFEAVGRRRLSRAAYVNHGRMSRGHVENKEWEKLSMAANYIASRNNMITDTTSNLSIIDIKARAKRQKLKQGLDVVIIDHLTLLNMPGNDRYDLKISEVTRQCKIMAKDFDIAVILLSQLSRKCEERTEKRPMLSDLRESGSIEQDADSVLFVYRDEYYDKESEYKGILELIIAKNRDGKTDTIKYYFKPEIQMLKEAELQ